jgi:hypothetical protein
LLPYFVRQARSTYGPGNGIPSVLERGDFRMILAQRYRKRPPGRDAAALTAAAAEVVNHPHLYVSLVDLDSISHEWGLASAEYGAHEALIAQGVERLVTRFRHLHGQDAQVVVLSDHGMAPVTATIGLEIEAKLGRPGWDSYLYFVDSTMIRVWCYDPHVRQAADDLLGGLESVGRLTTAEEREGWGLAERHAGDLIYVLHEGLVFEPNFIGRGVPRAMHGYHPDNASQHGVFLSSRPGAGAPERLGALAVHEALSRILAEAG